MGGRVHGAARWVALLPALLLAGCGEASSGGSVTDDDTGFDVAGVDVQYIINDAGEIIYLVDVRNDDVPGTDASEDTATFDPGPDATAGLVPCTEPSACQTGFCVEAADDAKYCAGECEGPGDCPSGWSCRGIAVGAEPLFVCLPPSPHLCQPCAMDDDCRAAGVPSNDFCVPYGDLKGSFCGADCTKSGKCPSGYDCRAVDLREGGSGRQCVPAEGECVCTAESVAAGQSTPCSQTNANGTCTGSRKCTADGLSVCDATLPAAEKCNNKDDDCDGSTDEGMSSGETCQLTVVGLGSCPGTSACVKGAIVCQGTPPIAESCDGLDSDCDGQTDPEDSDGCTVRYRDQDGDGAGLASDSKCLCAPEAPYSSDNGLDCDDASAAFGPGAAETCSGADEDCDGLTDEAGATGCTPFFADFDLDGWGDASTSACLCAGDAAHPVAVGGDCDDHDATIGSAGGEACDGKDNDCDGQTDEEGATGCVAYWQDGDGDGHGAIGESRCLCAPAAPWTAVTGDDCDDADAQAAPGTADVCDGKDNDCDGKPDPADALGCEPLYRDGDGDDYGTADSRCLCQPEGDYTATDAGDCDDAAAAVNPGATEACNGADDNCDSRTDEAGATGCSAWFKDADRDGYGTGSSSCLCAAQGDFGATVGDDCADTDSNVYPGATERCNAGTDDDCDGWADLEGSEGCTPYYQDNDGDGYGTPLAPRCLCAPSGKYTALVAGDCNDAVAGTAAMPETCNGKDDDCDASTDEDEGATGCSTWYADRDGDFHGDATDSKCLCGAQGVYRLTSFDDCDDADPAIPGIEACNSKDDDCDGSTDEVNATGCIPYYLDLDGDGWGVTVMMKCLCAPDAGYTTIQGGDCKDTDASIHPQAVEACNNVDDDCDGSTDDDTGTTTCGTGVCLKTVADCKAGKPQVCDPLAGASLTESCDLLDNDCDGITDEDFGTTTCGKGDCIHTVNNCRNGAIQGCNAMEGASPEVCDGRDNDCDGATDEDQGTVSCGVGPCLHSVQSCKNGVPQVCDPMQGATAEVCNKLDDDCDGSTDDDDACTTLYRIGIDPEDGGGTGACGCNGICEDAINLAIALKTKALLDADTAVKDKGGRWEVFLTRTTNTSPTPTVAARLGYLTANAVQRLVIVSGNTYQTCTTMNYTIGAEVHREAAADDKGKDLATKMAAQVSAHFETTNRGVKTNESLALLNGLSAPAVWLGVGFLTNSGEATKLNSDSWQQQTAIGILHAFQQNAGWVEFTPP